MKPLLDLRGAPICYTHREREAADCAVKWAGFNLALFSDRGIGLRRLFREFHSGELSRKDWDLRILFKTCSYVNRTVEQKRAMEKALVAAYRRGGKVAKWAAEAMTSKPESIDDLLARSLPEDTAQLFLLGAWSDGSHIGLPPLFLFTELGLFQLWRLACSRAQEPWVKWLDPEQHEKWESFRHLPKRLGLVATRKSRLDVRAVADGETKILRVVGKRGQKRPA